MKLRLRVGLGPGPVVLDGDPVPPPQRGTAPILAHICCGQMARWIQMPLGTEVSLNPNDTVLDGDPDHPLKKGHIPQFSAHVY